ncbi:YwqJ-related putative deaminase [Bacillus sp. JJ1764]|uniref:YwqJ-related putative deaminase n=1 Tax=Bacillus sp. JJ1764 TaxID=3122964 RepID=UPI002FFDC687
MPVENSHGVENSIRDLIRKIDGINIEGSKGTGKSQITELDDLLISRGFTRGELEKLVKHVNEEASVLKNLGLTKRELGAAVSGVYNKKTGKIYTAINNMDGGLPPELHPLIESKIKNMPKDIREGYIKTHGAGSHAEVYAINKALLDGANPEDIIGYVVKSGGTVKPLGDPFPMCPHCSYILQDFFIVSS